MTSDSSVRGFALIAVLVALSILLALTAPFVLSMGHGEAVATQNADQLHAHYLTRSARELVLRNHALGHRAIDPTPLVDGLEEFPAGLVLPKTLAGLADNGRNLLAGEAWDLQRRINLQTATPLVFANLLGLAGKLGQDHGPEADALVLQDAGNLPRAGFVVVDRELIRYSGRDGNTLIGLARGQRRELGYVDAGAHELLEGMLVLDWRTVLAVTQMFESGGQGARDRLVPWTSVEELARIGSMGGGTFTTPEMDQLRRAFCVGSIRETATEWGKPERLFSDLALGTATFQVRSTAFLPGGTLVRLRTLDGARREYALVWSNESAPLQLGTVNLPSRGYVNLLLPVVQDWKAYETVVEPLVPHAVNLNTAPPEVLQALVLNLRQGLRQRPQNQEERAKWKGFEPAVSVAEARQFAADLVALRTPVQGNDQQHALAGFDDLEQRVFKPRFLNQDETTVRRWMLVFRNLLNGRDGGVEFATAPACFHSAAIVAYRAAAARNRGSGQLAAREEVSGLAWCMPGTTLDLLCASQDVLEEALRLDRNAPWYLTWPINTGAGNTGDLGTNPISRHMAYAAADAFPGGGFGQPRFPSKSLDLAGFQLAPAVAAPFGRAQQFRQRQRDHESMAYSVDPEGRDLDQEGPYRLVNSGPTQKPGQQPQKSQSHDQIDFPLTARGGVVSRHAVAFWFKLRDLSEQCLYDLAAELPDRNRITLRIDQSHLVFEVMDEAGIDPDPSQSQSQAERTAGTWRVALQDANLRADVWYHASLSAEGVRPGQLTLLIDGVRRGEPLLRTYLTAEVPEFQPAQQNRQPYHLEKGLHPVLQVESTDGFPPQGVLRVGLELFEYTKKDARSFYCEYADSFGGRVARMDLGEFLPKIPTDAQGRPTKTIQELLQAGTLQVAPKHPSGSAVEFYGGSLPIYRDAILQPGAARLGQQIGAFAIARVGNGSNLKDITFRPPPPGQPLPLGRGLDETSTDDLDLADPLPDGKGSAFPPKPANERIAQGFPQGGGYALLLQWRGGLNYTPPGGSQGATIDVGGIELIRYSARTGTRLSGIKRAQLFPGQQPDRSGLFTGRANKYVLDWLVTFGTGSGRGIPGNELPQALCYVIPISLPVQGAGTALTDPTVLGLSEWMQLYDGQGDPENETEWVRYDRIAEGIHVVRSTLQAWLQTHRQLTGQDREFRAALSSGQIGDPTMAAALAYGPVPNDGIRRIGYTDRLEVDFPAVYAARLGLSFRGDPFTGTTAHAHGGNAVITQVHRFELDWGNYGAFTGRAGRNDRIALVRGSDRVQGNTPAINWLTINWSCRRFGWDAKDIAPGGERLGPWPFQLAGFKSGIGAQVFAGPSQRDDVGDPRLLDRAIKFPSGELPAAYCEQAWFGASQLRDRKPARGLVDEIDIVQHDFPRSQYPLAAVLDAAFDATAQEFKVRLDGAIKSTGWHGQQGVGGQFPQNGGLLRIDGEILAYETQADGLFKIARNGRGLLDSDPKAHDEGALVYFLDQVPCGILAESVQATSPELLVTSLNELPRFGGTVLLGTELLHYTWTSGDQMLEMPKWTDPAQPDTAGKGLLRGRYGTVPVGASGGEPVIWFPFRYWDRQQERADDPELAHFQLTLGEAPVYFTGLLWEAEEVDPRVQLHCLVRIDGRGSFAADPKQTPGLFRFEKGKIDGKANPIGFQGSRLEARFVTRYQPGVFDGATFKENAWKMAPRCKAVGFTYEGESRILEERVTAR